MKKILIVFVVIILIVAGVYFFKKNKSSSGVHTLPDQSSIAAGAVKNPSNGLMAIDTTKIPAGTITHTIVFKTVRDYSTLAWVGLSADKTKVISYPAPSDIIHQTPIKLHNGYLSGNIGFNTAYINIKIDRYAGIPNMLSEQQLYNLIVNKNPFSEIYDCGSTTGSSIDNINSSIDSGKLSSDCTKIL